MAEQTYTEWVVNYYTSGRYKLERKGQAFCNDFIEFPWPELYYAEGEGQAEEMIADWLYYNSYYNNIDGFIMPRKVQ